MSEDHGRNMARNPIRILISEVKQIRSLLTRILRELERINPEEDQDE